MRLAPGSLSGAAWLAAALLLACGRGAPEAGRPGWAPGGRLLLVAVDGLEPRIVDQLIAEGRLPHLARLVAAGSRVRMPCVTRPLSPVVWTSVATGVVPDRHGILDWTVDGRPVDRRDRRRPAMWNLLADAGVPAAVVGWLATWPAEPDAGIVISDRGFLGGSEGKAEPADAIDLARHQLPAELDLSFLPAFTTRAYQPGWESWDRDRPEYAIQFLLRKRLIDIYRRDQAIVDMTAEVLERHRPAVTAVYLQGIDYTSHGFWKYFEPEPFRAQGWRVDEGEVAALGAVVPRYYEVVDRWIGRLLARAGEGTDVIVLSDHGFGPGLGRWAIEGGDFLSGNHRLDAELILSGPSFRRGARSAIPPTHFDLLPTILALAGAPIPADLDGRPLAPFLSEGALGRLGLRYAPAPPEGEAEPAPRGAEAEESDRKLLEELRSLGYVH